MPMWLKRLVRPLIPDRVMARYRLRQHSSQVRANVVLLVEGRRRQRRWLAVTPDTYRVGDPPHLGMAQPRGVVRGDPEHASLAAAALDATDADSAVVGFTSRPRLVGRRRTEPAVEPVTVVVRPEMFDEVGGDPDGDLVGLVRRVRDAGGRLALASLGTRERPQSWRTDPLTEPVVVLLAAVPMHDVGGGSRTTQLALELLRRGVGVVYVAAFGTAEGADLGIRFVHPRLEQYRLDEFDAAVIGARSTHPGWTLVEVPLPAFTDPISGLRDSGWRVCYDLIDRWSDPGLGGDWYQPPFEASLIEESDVVIASAPDLVAVAEAAGRHDVTVVPNAVNVEVFARPPGPTPADLPVGSGAIIGYHGSLYGDWLDWGSLARVAQARPDTRVVIIGDDSKGHPTMPGNVHFLGLKAMQSLPDYVRRFDVGLVPFVVSETTHAVSPLKVYEYLACGVPVAAPPLRSLAGLDGVVVDDDLDAAVTVALASPRPDGDAALAAHSWARRVDGLVDLLGITLPGGDPALVLTRPAVHYPRHQRWLRGPSSSSA